MTPAQLLVDALTRSALNAEGVLAGLTADELAWRPGPRANSPGWLLWHLARVQDDHVAGAAGTEQVWTGEGYAERFGLPLDAADIGFGHTSEQVAVVRPEPELLAAYVRDVHARSTAWLATLGEADLDRVVDEHWDPPVTLGVRLVSVVDECAQHVGQAAYLRGLLGR